jgi:hypothetical protein
MSEADYIPYITKVAQVLDMELREKAIIVITKDGFGNVRFKITRERGNIVMDGGEVFTITAEELDRIFIKASKQNNKIKERNK